MKEIGDKCSGWFETEEQTELKNHLRWARIKVKGPPENIRTSIEVDDREWRFTLPVWIEAPARFEKTRIVEQLRGDKPFHGSGEDSQYQLIVEKEKAQRSGKGIAMGDLWIMRRVWVLQNR